MPAPVERGARFVIFEKANQTSRSLLSMKNRRKASACQNPRKATDMPLEEPLPLSPAVLPDFESVGFL